MNTSDLTWETFAPLIERPFPALKYLWVQPRLSIKNEIPRSFLGGSAPSLQEFVLVGVPFPTLPELLLSATNLVHLSYLCIPHSVYISPQAMITGLSELTRLESLSLTFQSRRPLPDRTTRISPPHTRTLLPALTFLEYLGGPEYMEDLVAQINAPLLDRVTIALFHRELLEVSELAKFVRRADMLSLSNRAKVIYRPDYISLSLSQKSLIGTVDHNTLMLILECPKSALRFSYLAQFCASSLPTLSPFECLHVRNPIYSKQDVIDLDPQWLELLSHF
jgi:hypothetical protein